MFPRVLEIAQYQIDAVSRWHESAIDHPGTGFIETSLISIVSAQHEQNFLLWHEEDKARNPIATDAEIANVKRNIDRFNQQRNDLIEKLDDAIAESLQNARVDVAASATVNTETPGSAIDRLSIMSLRIFHYEEQLTRTDVDPAHRERVAERLTLCRQQHADLSSSLQKLLDDLVAGRMRHKTYRQMKMYNDPSLNPAIYSRGS